MKIRNQKSEIRKTYPLFLASSASWRIVLRILLLSFITYRLSLSPVSAQVVDGVYNGDVVTLGWINTLFENVLSIMLSLIGVGAFVMLVVGSFQWLVSSGDQQKMEQAKATFTYAVVGIALVFLAWFVLVFISRFTGNDSLLQFNFQYQESTSSPLPNNPMPRQRGIP